MCIINVQVVKKCTMSNTKKQNRTKRRQKQIQHVFVNKTILTIEKSLHYCSFTHKSTHVMLRFLVIGKPAG